MIEEPYDKGDHIKSVFAYFGRAYYMANVFETGLAIALMQLDFLTDVMARLRREGRANFDRARYEADFDAFMEQQHAQTLGGLLKRFEALAAVDPSVKKIISEAKAKRDFLAHHYFRERSDEFVNRAGRDQMIAELDEAAEIFSSADKALDAILEPVRNKLGIYAKDVEAKLAEYLRSNAMED